MHVHVCRSLHACHLLVTTIRAGASQLHKPCYCMSGADEGLERLTMRNLYRLAMYKSYVQPLSAANVIHCIYYY